jgi:hypothetical protein
MGTIRICSAAARPRNKHSLLSAVKIGGGTWIVQCMRVAFAQLGGSRMLNPTAHPMLSETNVR